MFQHFYPDEVSNSAYDISYEGLWKQGKRGIIFDIDNTLVFHGAPANEEAKRLFVHLRELGFRTMVLSNNKEPRVKTFAEAVGTGYIYKANKPGSAGYIRAMEQMGTTKEQTVFIGDQLFTDVWGAKRIGLQNYLVKPLNPKEEIQIVLKRYLEKVVLYYYYKKRS